jgi:hypothetical protein
MGNVFFFCHIARFKINKVTDRIIPIDENLIKIDLIYSSHAWQVFLTIIRTLHFDIKTGEDQITLPETHFLRQYTETAKR